MHFFGQLYFSHYGVLRPEIFIRATDWPSPAGAHPNWECVPPQKNYPENLKFTLKFSVLAPITSGLLGVSSQNFFQMMCIESGVIKSV